MTLMKKKRGISDDEEHKLNYEACLLAMICIKEKEKKTFHFHISISNRVSGKLGKSECS